MVGNVRFELASVSPEESGFSANYPNGQRGNYPGASLDRSGSFLEGGEGRMFNSGTGSATGDLPSLSQCLTLEPITMGDQKYPRLGELRRALGSFGSTAEDNSFEAAHAKPPPPVASEELKRLKASVAEASMKARVRTKMFDKALDGVEGRNNALPRQSLVIGKDRDMLKDGGSGSDLVDERTRKLPAGGEGWDKKMKLKRSVGSVFIRPMDGDGNLKRAMHQKLGNESGLQSCDAQGFRSGSLSRTTGINKLESTSFPASSNVQGTTKNELEKVFLARDLSAGLAKDRLVAKGNNKLNICDDNPVVSSSPVTKGKGSRAPRTGTAVGPNLSPNFPRSSGALEGWEQPPSENKVQSIGGANN